MRIDTTSGSINVLEDDGKVIQTIPFGKQNVTPRSDTGVTLQARGAKPQSLSINTPIDGITYNNTTEMARVLGSFNTSSSTESQGVTPQQLNARVPEGGTTGQVLKKQSDGTNAWATDSNTTYSVLSEQDFIAGTSTASRVISAASLNRDIASKLSGMIIEDDLLTEEQTSQSLNTKYPDAKAGFAVYAPNVGTGMFYRKVNSENWFVTSGFLV